MVPGWAPDLQPHGASPIHTPVMLCNASSSIVECLHLRLAPHNTCFPNHSAAQTAAEDTLMCH